MNYGDKNQSGDTAADLVRAMEARLARLERDNRRLRRGFVAGACAPVLLVALLVSAGWKGGLGREEAARDVEARSLKIVDARGRAVTVVNENGVSLFDGAGKVRAIFSVVDGTPTLGLLDGSGGVRAAIGVTGDGESSLTLNDKTRRPALSLAATETAVGIVLTSPVKRGEMTLGVGSSGPAITLRDAAGKPVTP